MYGAGYSVNVGELLQKFKLFNSACTQSCSFPGWAMVVIALFLFWIHTVKTQSSQWSRVISFSYLYSSISTKLDVPEQGVPDCVQVGVIYVGPAESNIVSEKNKLLPQEYSISKLPGAAVLLQSL